MTQTVIGIFDDPGTAAAAGDALIDQGIDESSIYVSIKSGGRGASGQKGQSMEAIRGFLGELFGSEDSEDAEYFAQEVDRGAVLLSVDLPDDAELDTVRETLEEAGALELETTGEEEDSDASRETSQRVPVVEEETEIGKKQVGKGKVRVFSRMVETPVEEDVTLRDEFATVKRHPVDKPVSPEEVNDLSGETIEVEETTERPVVSKSARIVEEVEVGKEAEERVEKIRDTERHTEVEVQREAGERGKGKSKKR